jgi:hypothetical protein
MYVLQVDGAGDHSGMVIVLSICGAARWLAMCSYVGLVESQSRAQK